MLPALFTVREVAARLGLSESAVYAQIHRGRLRALRITPAAIRIREADLDHYLDPVGAELTVSQVAQALRLSTSEVYRLIRKRRMPALRRGRGSVRVLERALLQYIDSRPGAGETVLALQTPLR